MATVVPAPPALSNDLALFHTTDPLLGNSPVLIFHGPATTIGATSSRIQVHIFTPAGIGSYARLAVSPNSPLYSAVSNLPREEQGDEICRGIAFGLKKYFTELPDTVKKAWCGQGKAALLSTLFGDHHVAILASRMTKIENVEEVIEDIFCAFAEQRLPWVDVDLVLPPGTIKEWPKRTDSGGPEDMDDAQALKHRFGPYAEIVGCLGETAFLPTSKLKRAPSKATSIGRSASFLKHQKENVRKEILELAETEENYVARLQELQSTSQSIGSDLKLSSQQRLVEVFPESIGSIVKANSGFLDALKAVVDASEQSAADDIEATTNDTQTAQQTRQDLLADTQGIDAVARCLCDWLPQFAESYTSYMQAHAQAALQLRKIVRGNDTAIQAAVQEIGEQRLTSLLIEPVQRLPRYNLYIDSISKQLPARHPALKHLLKARDIVSEICSQDESGNDAAQLTEKLRSRVSSWPADAQVNGRLVTATDFTELAAPYNLQNCTLQSGMLLLFTDSVVLIERCGSNATSTWTFMAEIESSVPPSQLGQSRPGTPKDLRFIRQVSLSDINCNECHDGQSIHLVCFGSSVPGVVTRTAKSQQVLLLEGAYEGKANRLLEEIVKARVEGCFSEEERESTKWEVRATSSLPEQLSLFSAIFEDAVRDHVEARRGCSSVRIVVDLDKHANRPRAGQSGIHTVIALSPMADGLCRMSVDSIDGPGGREHVAIQDVNIALRRKLAVLSASRLSIDQVAMTSLLISRNSDSIRSIQLQIAQDDEEPEVARAPSQDRGNRPKSPVKLLSSFLSSTGPGSQPPSFLRKDYPVLPVLGATPRMPPPAHLSVSKPPSRESRPSSKDQATPKSLNSRRSMEMLSTPSKKLEDTLSTYMLALQARKGNIVGRSLKMRATADELAVNELYNSLLEDPNMMVVAAEAAVDVLFAAFEKFVNIAWKEQVGQIMPYDMLQDIQSKADTMFPRDFDEYFRTAITALAPQNQRAFKGIMKLLADLLDGTGNDGDRGIMTAAFAEVLVTEGNPHHFIPLIDRFVDDTDTYFGEPLAEVQNHIDDSIVSQGSHKRSRSVNTGSITSNTSSLRRKFGFGTLTRENSKSEQDSKVASVWRTLSKSTRADASPANSISRGTLHRAHSSEAENRLQARPSSQDGPANRKASGFDELTGLNGVSASTQNLGLSTIGEHPSFIPTGPPRKKRRSSLSDLLALEAVQKSPPWSPPAAARRPAVPHNPSLDKSLPNSPMSSTPSSKANSGRYGSPVRETPRSRLPSSFRMKENSPGPSKALSITVEPSASVITPEEESKSSRPLSSIPTLAPRAGSPGKGPGSTPARALSDRPSAANVGRRPSPPAEKPTIPKLSASSAANTGSLKKMRVQSPQKLRERLQNEQAAITATQTALQDELSKIGDELTSTPSRIGSVRTLQRPTPGGRQQNSTPMDVAARVLKLEHSLPSQLDSLTSRLSGIQADLASSLAVSENKNRKLDELYREANSENEALYARFNDELARVVKAVRTGEGVEEMRKKMREAQEEVARLRKENGRLKRENVGLRAQLKE